MLQHIPEISVVSDPFCPFLWWPAECDMGRACAPHRLNPAQRSSNGSYGSLTRGLTHRGQLNKLRKLRRPGVNRLARSFTRKLRLVLLRFLGRSRLRKEKGRFLLIGFRPLGLDLRLGLDCRFKMIFFCERLNNLFSAMSRIGFIRSFQQS
jgi:hypothetical protein